MCLLTKIAFHAWSAGWETVCAAAKTWRVCSFQALRPGGVRRVLGGWLPSGHDVRMWGSQAESRSRTLAAASLAVSFNAVSIRLVGIAASTSFTPLKFPVHWTENAPSTSRIETNSFRRFGGEMDPYLSLDHKRSALITIDIQRDTLDGQPFEIPRQKRGASPLNSLNWLYRLCRHIVGGRRKERGSARQGVMLDCAIGESTNDRRSSPPTTHELLFSCSVTPGHLRISR